MTAALSAPLRDNFRFLWREAGSQVAMLRDALEQGSIDLARKVIDRSGYADNLKMRVRDGCITAIMQAPKSSPDALMLRAVESIAIDLERLTRLCRDCVKQYETLQNVQRRKRRGHAALLAHVEQGLELMEQAIDESDTATALKAIKVKNRIDEDYKQLIGACNADLRNRKDPPIVIASIFMAQRIEEMGVIIQDMGDAVISANMGQQLTTDRYRSLSETVKRLRGNRKTKDLSIEPLAQTRSAVPFQVSPILGRMMTAISPCSRMANAASLRKNVKRLIAGMRFIPAWRPKSCLSIKNRIRPPC